MPRSAAACRARISPTRNSTRCGPRPKNSARCYSSIRKARRSSPSAYKGNGWLSNTIGNPLDTTIALQHLIFEGTLDRFPGLKILAAHGGGYLGSYAARSDHACFVSPQNCNPNITLKKKPSEYLNQLYFDAMVFTPEGLRHLVAQVGASQIVLGTDHPIPWEQHPVDHVFATTTLTDKQKIAILGGNAARLFGIRKLRRAAAYSNLPSGPKNGCGPSKSPIGT